LAPFALALCLVTSCSDDSPRIDGLGPPDRAGADESDPRSVSGSAKPHDPPLAFEPSSPHPVAGGYDEGKWAVRLVDTTVFGSSNGEVKAVDALDGKELWNVKPRGTPAPDDDYIEAVAAPTLVRLDGKPAVLAVFAVTVQGSGTTPDRSVIELTAVAADSGKRIWTSTIERPRGLEKGDPLLVGSDGTTAVIRLGEDSHATTLGVPLDTRRISWTAPEFHAVFVEGDTVVGRRGSGIDGLRTADGTNVWTYGSKFVDTKLRRVGGGLFTAEAQTPRGTQSRVAALLDIATGRPRPGFDPKTPGEPTDLSCVHDERATIVCTAEHYLDERLFALDAVSFEELWAIDDQDETRLMPRVSTAWHGAVYASTRNGPVVLDARTGRDRATDPGITPFAVNAYVGLTSESLNGTSSHRAIG
jgi:outer membrane protein assembly factor BamB